MNRYEIEQQQVTDAIALFPATFGLRAFPGDVFRIGARSSYVSDGTVYLYTERRSGTNLATGFDLWQSFAKGTPAELRDEVVSLKGGQVMSTNIRDQVFDKSALYSPGNGRDYLKTPEGEVFSINGLYCDAQGNIDRYGRHVKIMDIRWTVVVWQVCYVGLNPDFTDKKESRLVFTGDNTDEQVLAHYGYRMYRDDNGYKNILPASQEAK